MFRPGPRSSAANSTVAGMSPTWSPPGAPEEKVRCAGGGDTITVPPARHFAIVASLEKAEGEKGTKLKDQEGTIEGRGKSNKGIAKTAGEAAAGGAAVGPA